MTAIAHSLINFELVPVEKIKPWGEPGELSLSWFGLTDGQYWIQAGESRLFEYSKHVRDQGWPRFCDYQIVRLYEDLLEILPYILEPIPDSLINYISGESGVEWEGALALWETQNDENLEPDQYCDCMVAANGWRSYRTLDSGYLRHSPKIMIWSDEVAVHIEWDNRTKTIDGQCVWTALYGEFTLPREEFKREILSFHTRLMEQMAIRVDQVLSGALAPEIRIDLVWLKNEHEERCLSLEMALGIQPKTDWSSVENSIHKILNEVKR
jgi:hypothetical protein